MKYKLVRKVNPTLKKKQWYAIPQYSLRQAGDKTVRSAARNTTFSYAEVMAALSLVGEYLPTILAEGHTVKIPGLGSLRLSFRSTGGRRHPRLQPPHDDLAPAHRVYS